MMLIAAVGWIPMGGLIMHFQWKPNEPQKENQQIQWKSYENLMKSNGIH